MALIQIKIDVKRLITLIHKIYFNKNQIKNIIFFCRHNTFLNALFRL